MGNGWEIGEFWGENLGVLVIYTKILGNFAFFKKTLGFFKGFQKFFGIFGTFVSFSLRNLPNFVRKFVFFWCKFCNFWGWENF